MELRKKIKKIKKSSKDFAKKALLFLTITGAFLSDSSAQVADKISIFPPTKQIEEIVKEEEVQDLITTTYAEGGYFKGDNYEETPVLLNVMMGYNILKNRLEDGVFYCPNFRVLFKEDNSENPWNRYLDLAIGIAYQRAPIIIGAEAVHKKVSKENVVDAGGGGDFFRFWGGIHNIWEQRALKIERYPNRLWGTHYLEFNYDTLNENAVGDFRTEINFDALNLKGLVIGPYISGKINVDSEDMPWNNYFRGSGGIRLRKGPINIFFEKGYKSYFNKDNGSEDGEDYAIYGGIWNRF